MKKGYFKLDHSYKGHYQLNGSRECCICNKSFPLKYEFKIVFKRKECTICEQCLLETYFENFNKLMVKDPNDEWWELREM